MVEAARYTPTQEKRIGDSGCTMRIVDGFRYDRLLGGSLDEECPANILLPFIPIRLVFPRRMFPIFGMFYVES
jgi:hypothetical protein